MNAKSRYYYSCSWTTKLVKGDWVKKGAIVIDVGINKPQVV